jgi:hypothetical protein
LQQDEDGSTAMRRVILKSPYAGNVALNLAYARAAPRDGLRRRETACASHLLFPQDGVPDDGVPEERALGMAAGFTWLGVAEARVVHEDLGVSRGMAEGIARAKALGLPVERRRLPAGEFARLGAR